MNPVSSTLKVALLSAFLTASCVATAAVSEKEASRLGADLTPFGAEKAANADGSIPAWTGGNTTVPAGFKNVASVLILMPTKNRCLSLPQPI